MFHYLLYIKNVKRNFIYKNKNNMKILKLYEEYVNSASNKLSTLLDNMVQMFYDSFQGNNDVLGKEDLQTVTLIEVDRSTSNDAFEKNLLLTFEDPDFYYNVFFIVKIEDIKEKIDKGYMKIVMYDQVSQQQVRTWQKNVDVLESTDQEINDEGRFFVKVKESGEGEFDYIENFLISKIAELKGQFKK